MKYIRLFQTASQRAAATIFKPSVIFTKETEALEFINEDPINSDKNAELMAVCYAQGWAAHENYMTYEECAAVTDAQLADSVTIVTEGGTTTYTSAFTQVVSLSELRYFTGITAIPAYCFYQCASITSVILPTSLREIGANAFSGCSGLTNKEITLHEGLERIGSYGLACPLYKAVVPSTCNTIGDRALLSVKRIDLTATSIVKTPYACYNNPIWVKFPSTCTASAGKNNIGTYGYGSDTKGWIWFDCEQPYGGTYGDDIGGQFPVRIYVKDSVVDTWKGSTVPYNNGDAWSTKADYIFPQSQWEQDLANELIRI